MSNVWDLFKDNQEIISEDLYAKLESSLQDKLEHIAQNKLELFLQNISGWMVIFC